MLGQKTLGIKPPGNRRTSLTNTPTDAKDRKTAKKSSQKKDADVLQTVLNVVPVGDTPALLTNHRDLEQCPCGNSSDSWKIDCSKCHQFWHVNCLSMKGMGQSQINKLVEYLCPFCYVAPVPTIKYDLDVCHVCRNTLSLQQSNLELETALISSQLEPLAKCCKLIKDIDFVEFSNRIDTLGQFDQRLKHLLLDDQSLKSLDSDMKLLSDQLATTLDQSSSLQSFESINANIAELQKDLKLLASRPSPESSPSTDSTEQFLKSISERLTALSENEPTVTAGINELKESISSIQSLQHPGPSITPTPSLFPCPAQTTCPPIPPVPEQSIPHSQIHVSDNMSDFITIEEANTLTTFLESCSFKPENGHSVYSVGVPYEYMGSKSSDNVPPIPEELKPLFEKINKVQAEIFNSANSDSGELSAPIINSCLINRYDGPTSYLPRHSDREITINPESSILTLSLGQLCDIKFIEKLTGVETTLACPNRSLYHMTRRSQEVFDHMIDVNSIDVGIRYSLTFRSVDWRNKNSTCIIGDSNTGMLRFGSCKRSTFGELMPGRKFWSPRIDDIDPKSCMGYANVVLLCGINDVKQPDVKSQSDIVDIYQKLKLKVKQIQKLSPNTTVSICKLLPTKDMLLNEKVNTFNRAIHFNLLQTCKGVQRVDGFMQFAQNNALARELSKQFDRHGQPDMLHLNRTGARVLAGLIKQSIFLRLNGGRDKRRRTGRVNGRLYSNVASNSAASQQTTSGG